MNVVFLYECLLLAILLNHPGDVAAEFTPAPPTCPGDTFIFRCNVTGDMNGFTIWRVGASSNLCVLLHMSTTTIMCMPSGTSNAFTVTPGTGFGPGTSATLYSSTLSGTATPELDGTLVECFGPTSNVTDAGNMVGNSTIHTIGPPSVNLSCVELSEAVSGSVNVTVNWTLSGGDSVDFYLINITCTDAPQLPHEGLVNITNTSVTHYELTGFLSGYEYNITIHGVTVNCGGLVGSMSEPLTIRPQVPAVSISCNLTLSYNQSSERLLSIFSTWESVPDPVDPDPGDICPGPSGNVTQYQIDFETGSFVVNTSIVSTTMCKDRTCNHTFEPPSNPPSSYDRVFVVAENVVGTGDARNLTTQPINTTNNLLIGDVVDVSLPNNARLNCTFLSGFTGSAHCTVQYGTDPTYMNLPYSAESTETGTAGDTVSVILREQLNSSTVYYYTVSAVSGNLTVVVLAPPFMTGCFLNELWNLHATDGAFLPDVSLLGDAAAQYPTCDDSSVGSVVLEDTTLNTTTVAYYTGTTPGSSACFVCNNASGYALNTTNITERVCQTDGRWSRSPIVCGCPLEKLWNLSATDGTFLPDVSLLNDTATQYPNCDAGSTGSAVLRDNRLNTATVAYYNGTTTGSRACFVCDMSNGYELNTTTTTERVCQRDGTWSGSSIICVCTRTLSWQIALIVIGVLALIVAIVIVVAIAVWVVLCQREDCKKLLKFSGEKMERLQSALIIFASSFSILGVVLWIVVGPVGAYPPNGNMCNPSWNLTIDGLTSFAFSVSIVTILAAAMTLCVYCYKRVTRSAHCCCTQDSKM